MSLTLLDLDGEEIWTIQADDVEDVSSDYVAVYLSGGVKVTSANDGTPIAFVPTISDHVDDTDAALLNSTLVIAENDNLTVSGCSLPSGDLEWTRSVDTTEIYGLAGHGNVVWVTVSNGGEVLDQDGIPLWSDTESDWELRLFLDGKAFFAATADELSLIDAETGAIVGRATFSTYPDSDVVAAEDMLLVPEGTSVRAYELPTLTELWTLETGLEIDSLAAVNNGLLVESDGRRTLTYYE